MSEETKKPFLDSVTAMPKEAKETSWRSIYIAGSCAFIQATQFSIFFSSMYPYLLSLNDKIKPNDFGIVVAIYSLAQSIASPLFGYWSSRIGEVSLPLKVGFVIMSIGNICYISLPYLPAHHLYAMMAARAISGSGTGNMSLLRSYASSASTSKDRGRALACVSGGIAVGVMMGPGMQIIFTPLGGAGKNIFGFNVNIYNSPAILSLVIDLLGLCVVHFAFQEEYLIDVKKKKSTAGKEESIAKPCAIALAVCIVTRFLQVFVQTSTETIGSAFSMMMFSFESEKSVAVNASIHTIAGAIAATLYVLFIILDISKYMRMRTFIVSSLLMGLVMYLSTYAYPFYPENVILAVNGTEADCDPRKYDWCNSLTKIPIWLYYGGYIINFGVGNSFMNISLTTLYSKVVGPRPQGTYQGFFQMAGSIGRLLSPLLISNMYSFYGPRATWAIDIGFILSILFIWLIFHKKMIPFEKAQLARVNTVQELSPI